MTVSVAGGVSLAPSDLVVFSGAAQAALRLGAHFGVEVEGGMQSSRVARASGGLVDASLAWVGAALRAALRFDDGATELAAGLGLHAAAWSAHSEGFIQTRETTFWVPGGHLFLELRRRLFAQAFFAARTQLLVRLHDETFTIDGVGVVLRVPMSALCATVGVGWAF